VVAGRNFTRLEVNAVRLSLHGKVSFRILKKCPVSAQGPPACRRGPLPKMGLKYVVFPLKFNGGHKTEKAELGVFFEAN